jgi:hypothetical protein
VEGGARRLPAVSWDADLDALAATLELPPGWRLLHASGVDRADPTWISRWTLLDLFVVMVVAMATLRLFGARAGGLALATLLLVYTEPGAPQWIWLLALAAEALRSVVPEGRLARAVRGVRLASLASLILISLPLRCAQLRAGLFPRSSGRGRGRRRRPRSSRRCWPVGRRCGDAGGARGRVSMEMPRRSRPTRKEPRGGTPSSPRTSMHPTPMRACRPAPAVPTGAGSASV